MIYLFLAEGFEEVEALTPIDMLRRAGCKVTTVAVGNALSVVGSHGIEVKADALIDDISEDDARGSELIVLPGGMPGTTNIDKSEKAHRLINAAYDNGKRLAAICAAPMILGKMGLLEGKNAVCYTGFEEYLKGATVCTQKAVTDGRITTARGAGAAIEFALELVTVICGKDVSEKIRHGIIAD